MTEPDVVVVGAGAAGIGAGMALRAARIPFVILEAQNRIGGRAFTDRASLPGHWDQGCQWFHSADINPLVPWAELLGSEVERQDRTEKSLVWNGGWLDPSVVTTTRRKAIRAAFDAVYAAAAADRDQPIAEVLPDGGTYARFIRHILQLLGCDDPEAVSAKGYGQYLDTGVNWVVTSGLGDLFERMAAGLPIRTGVPVTALRERSGGVAVDTAGGTIRAKAAIVTASTGVLNAGAITFGPGPANDLLDHIADVPCGSYEKVAIALDQLPEGISDELFCWIDPGGDATAADFQIVGGAHPKLIAHVAGSVARDLMAAGEAAAVGYAIDSLRDAFGADISARVLGTAVTGWQSNPFFRGGYSYSRPGAADRRLAMIGAETGPIAFAGEAFSPRSQATAHGAWQSGQDVAARVIRSAGLG
ncbi:MAG: FAD-dependent oxidoreductase [Rhodobacteraceae bacterium]|nr:FAD-dependent oxidoreductase [Paracoccaceae bacterium]